VHGVNAHKAGAPVGPWRAAHADRIAHRTRPGEVPASALVGRALAQVVQVRHRQSCQPFVACIAIDAPGALQQVHDDRTADILVGAVHLHQQLDVDRAVLACERCYWRSVALDQWRRAQAVLTPARHQPGELRAAVAAGTHQVRPYHAAIGLGAGVVKASEHRADVPVALAIAIATMG
jgi:hypothetical protein